MADKRLVGSFIVCSVYLCSQEGREGVRKEVGEREGSCVSEVVGRLCEVGTYFYNVDNSCVRTMLVRTGCGLDFPWETFQAIIPVILYRNIIVKKGKPHATVFILEVVRREKDMIVVANTILLTYIMRFH